ncbi:hypothetical protein RBB84_02555 [Rhodococcus sp. D-6]|uniref:Uncharacterized protein n=1 Tax=Rhodococcus sp. D-6 TaxID=1387842 RepID=A0AAU7V0P0_9NOCA|nr:hypothetical protein [Rhodococcus sp. HS-D2]
MTNRAGHERIVAAAIKDGRVHPARRGHWLEALQPNPEQAERLLASLAPGLPPEGEPWVV